MDEDNAEEENVEADDDDFSLGDLAEGMEKEERSESNDMNNIV